MAILATTQDLLEHLAGRPGHDEVKADFRDLLVREFGVELASLDFEKRVPVVRGRLDALIGRTVFEAKRDLDREMDDVLRRMPDYLADRQREEGEPFVGIASDGRRWIAFELIDGELVKAKETVLDPAKAEAFLAWLDGVVALRGSLSPDPLTIRAELGHESIAYRRVDRDLRALWETLKLHPAEALKRQLWGELLKLVYGREIEGDALWFQHSYLVVVAKCIALAVMELPEDDPKRLLSGEAFTAAGIHGAVESDFFDWMVASPDGEALVRRIMAHVRRFRLREVESDVLKILYESLIDRDERHGLGEYYTPDWLAAKVVRHAVTAPLEQKVLDPACGSGTFLFHAVRQVLAEAEEAGIAEADRAGEAVRHVTGMDIHPVAVIIARVTVLLALAPVLRARRGSLAIPVYLGDAMQLGIAHTLNETRLEIVVPPPPAGAAPSEGRHGREVLSFPETICRDPALFDKVIERMRTASLEEMPRDRLEAALIRIVTAHINELPADPIERNNRKGPVALTDEHRRAVADLGSTYETFHRLRLEGRDTIWSYVARNLSRPLALATGGGWANVIVGNPPWVAFRHMSADLQKRFKELANGEGVFVGGRFATQNDLCGLFTVRASHLYLRPSGRIAFVLPLAALTRGQFETFRRGRFSSYSIAWDEAWTMDDSVVPLFPVPSCTVFGRKRAIAKGMPETVRAYSGSLPMRDAPEAIADKRLKVAEGAPAPQTGVFTEGSPYRAMFHNGATLYPRMLSLVERKSLGRVGPDPSAPLLTSLPSIHPPWSQLPPIEHTVEVIFVRSILLSESILPYRIVNTVEAVIPVDHDGHVLDSRAARNVQVDADRLSGWLALAEKVWDDNKTASTKLSWTQQLNYNGKLESQFPIPQLRVVYAKSGGIPAASILRDSNIVAENSTYWGIPVSESEGYYLAAILNSETARSRAERYQARGQFGARHFDKVMFNLPIPVFDAEVKLHRDLAAAGAQAERVAGMVDLVEGERFVAARQRVRRALVSDGIAADIEKAVEKLLGPALAH